MGSKSRISKKITPIIQDYIDKYKIQTYIEPFVGGSNVIDKIKCEKKYGFDNNRYLIEFWKMIQSGWNPLNSIEMTKELYQDIKDNKQKYHPSMVALAGFCATYNAKWFGGYAGVVQTKIGTERNYYDEAVRNVLKQVPNIKDVIYNCKDYVDVKPINSIIYCDPPYEGTTKYKDDFNHEQYWDWVRKTSRENIIICSEYKAPSDFKCIFSTELTTTLDKNSRSKAIEKLFTYNKGIKEIAK